MGSVGKAISGAVNKFSQSTVGKVLAPTFTIPAQFIQKATGLTPANQLMVGAGVGGGLAAMGAFAPGAMAGLNGMLPGAAGAAAGAGGSGTAGIGGTTAALGPGGSGVLAQSGGVPLLTKVLLGGSVASTIAGYFGKKQGQDYDSWFQGLDQDSQAQIKSLQDNLTEVQNNVDVRNQAVSKIIDDYPSVAKQVYDGMKAGNEKTLGAYDQGMQATLDHAANQLSAKFASTGGFSSGAFNQGLADEAYKVAQPRADLAAGLSNQAESMYAQTPLTQMQARLSEAQAQRDFQQKMLGQGSQNIFNAGQARLGQLGQSTAQIANMRNNQNIANNQSTQQLFGSLGSTLGSAAMFPLMQQLYNPNRMGSAQAGMGAAAPQARLQLPNDASAGMGG